MLTEFRCRGCNKLLGKIKGEAEIKCSRCGSLNYVEVLQGYATVAAVKQVQRCTVGATR